jgi:hypothetical protein
MINIIRNVEFADLLSELQGNSESVADYCKRTEEYDVVPFCFQKVQSCSTTISRESVFSSTK